MNHHYKLEIDRKVLTCLNAQINDQILTVQFLLKISSFRSGLIMTEDMSRTIRENWGELHKFMNRVSSSILQYKVTYYYPMALKVFINVLVASHLSSRGSPPPNPLGFLNKNRDM